MTEHVWKRGRVNVKALVVLVVVVTVLIGAAGGAWVVRSRVISKRAFAQGLAAYDQKDWPQACEQFYTYLRRNPDDLDILKKYAQAHLSIRPLALKNIGSAINAYRRCFRFDPEDPSVYEHLARLYTHMRKFDDLGYLAQKRLEQIPHDPQATIWLGTALTIQHNTDQAKQVLTDLLDDLDRQTDRSPHYVDACLLLCDVVGQSQSDNILDTAQAWLDRAIRYDPQAADPFIARAKLTRLHTPTTGPRREVMLTTAQEDLARADALNPTDPRHRLVLCEEWIEHDRLDRAEAELQTIQDVDPALLAEWYLDPNDWMAQRFLVAARIALRRHRAKAIISQADEVLATLTRDYHRIMIIPAAIRLYAAAERPDKARQCFDEYITRLRTVSDRRDLSEQIAVLRGIVSRAEKRPYHVIESLEPIAARNPSRPTVWKLLAEAYSQTEQTRRAIRALTQYIRYRPQDRDMTLRLAQEYMKLRQWKKALDAAKLAEPSNPTDVVIKLLRIEASLYVTVELPASAREQRQGTLAKLGRELAALRESYPDREEIRILQAIVAANRDRPDQAEAQLKRAIQECSETLRAELQLAWLYEQTDRAKDAEAVLAGACKRHGRLATPWLARAESYRRAGHYAKAHAVLKEGLRAGVAAWEKRDLTTKLAVLDILYGDRPAGIAALRGLASEEKRDIRVRSLLLRLPDALADSESAQTLVDEIRAVEGDSGLTWRLHQARLWLAGTDWRNRRENVVGVLQRCIDADPEWSAPVLLMGNVYEQLGDQAQAEAVYRRGLAMNASAVAVADRLVTLLERQDRFAEVKDVLENVRAGPRTLSVRRIRAAIGAGDLDEAVDELKLRVAGDDRDVTSRILLARLIYQQTKDAGAALAYLDEAEKIASDALAITITRVAILKAQGHPDRARQLLDARIQRDQNFEAYFLRAAFLAGTGELSQAEADYRRLTRFRRGGKGCELLGKFYRDTKRLDDAIAAWQEGLTRFPENVPLQRRLMKALLVRNSPDDRREGLALLADLEKRLPDDPDLMTLRAILLFNEGTAQSVDQAHRLFERCVQLAPSKVDAHLGLITIAMQRRNYTTARELAIRAQGANPTHRNLMLARAKAERALGNFSLAKELARMVLRESPSNGEACQILVDAAIQIDGERGLEQTRVLIDNAAGVAPTDAKIVLAQTRLMQAAGQADAAIARLKAYDQTQEDKPDPTILLALAELCRIRGEFDQADRWLARAEAIAKDNVSVRQQRILWHAARGEFDAIVALVADYRTERAAHANMLTTAASILASSGLPDHQRHAAALFEHVIAVAPYRTDARLGQAALAYQAGDTERAIGLYRQILKAEPNNVRALNDLAWILADAHKAYQDAIDLADKGVALAGQDVHLRDTRAMILSHLPDRLGEARTEYEICLKLAENDPARQARTLMHLADVCLRLKDRPAAARYVEQAREIDRQHQVLTDDQRRKMEKIQETLSQISGVFSNDLWSSFRYNTSHLT